MEVTEGLGGEMFHVEQFRGDCGDAGRGPENDPLERRKKRQE